MTRKLKPADSIDVMFVEEALQRLISAQQLLKNADCPKALARVRAAISSTEGALRHVRRRAANVTLPPKES